MPDDKELARQIAENRKERDKLADELDKVEDRSEVAYKQVRDIEAERAAIYKKQRTNEAEYRKLMRQQ